MTTAADLKRELEELASKRSKIEEIVSDATARLEEVGVGMDVPMVDSEVINVSAVSPPHAQQFQK